MNTRSSKWLICALGATSMLAFGCSRTDRGEDTTPPGDPDSPLIQADPQEAEIQGEPMTSETTEGEDTTEQKSPEEKVAAADRKFVRDAAEDGALEVALGELAVQKASNPEVKKFGQRMVDDHGRANEKLAEAAAVLGVEIPKDPPAEAGPLVEDLRKLTGKSFDQRYMAEMVERHQQDIEMYRTAADAVQSPDLKAYIGSTLPVLEQHLQHAETVQAGKPYRPEQASAKSGS